MKTNRVDVVVVTPHASQLHHVPTGMIYVDEMLSQANLWDRVDQQQSDLVWLATCLKAITRKFGHIVRVRLLDPMTLLGLYFVIRYRIRVYPTVVMPDGTTIFHPSSEEFLQTIANFLKSLNK